MNKLWIIGFWHILSLYGQGQSKYNFQLLIDKYNPVKISMPVTLEVNGARVTTNNDGIFSLDLKPADRFITIHSLDPRYLITYPLNGTVFIPVNNLDIPNILLGMPSPQQTTQEAIKILRQLDSIRNDLKEAHAGNLDQVLVQRQDSILALAKKNYSISDADLRTAREVMEGRDHNFNRISVGLNNYLNQAKNLKDAFAQIAAFAFNNAKALKLLDSTIYLYSAAYDTLNNNHAAWEQAIRNFWFSAELALNFQNVIDFTLNDLHREYFLILNEEVIHQINAFLNESNTKKKNALKQSVISQINAVIPQLNNRLNILDTKTNIFLNTMQSMNNDYHVTLTSNQ